MRYNVLRSLSFIYDSLHNTWRKLFFEWLRRVLNIQIVSTSQLAAKPDQSKSKSTTATTSKN